MSRAARHRAAPAGARAGAGRVACRFMAFPWILAALGLAWSALPAGARVYETIRGAADPVRAVAPGAEPAYETTWQLNGGAGGVDVRVCPGSVAAVLERLVAAYREQGALAFCLAGERLGWGVVLYQGRVIRLLAAQTGPGTTCLLFRFEQTEQSFARSAADAPALPPGFPAYPGSRVTRVMRNAATGTLLAFAAAQGDRADVLRYFHQSLTDAGWTPALGPRDGASGVYLKGPEMMCVTVVSAGQPGRCVITVLHRRLKAKPDA